MENNRIYATVPPEMSNLRAFRKRQQIKNKRIEIVKNGLEPKSMKDIQVLLGYASLHQCFIQSLTKLAGSLTSMLRTTTTRSVKNSLVELGTLISKMAFFITIVIGDMTQVFVILFRWPVTTILYQ